MQLYKDRQALNDIATSASQALQIPIEIIEKDYFVTIILKRLKEQIPNLLFKGGTSLSKCYGLIKRFSEDIDLTIVDDFTQGNRQNVKRIIVDVIAELGFDIVNLNSTKSKRDFNKYVVDYKPEHKNLLGLKENIYIETVFTVKTFPIAQANVDSLIYQFLKSISREDIITTYELEPYEITTQSIERTFIDKVFALCDYYINGNIKEHSRHIYDLYKIADHINFNTEFKNLIVDVRDVRKNEKQCLSAKENYDINILLSEILAKSIYENDYNNITKKLLYEDVSYKQASQILKQVIVENIF